MSLRFVRIALVAAVILIPVVTRGATAGPGACPSDSKLLNGGPTRVFGSGAGTWWGLVINGLVAAGFDVESEQIAYLNSIFGTDFDTLAELQAFNIQQVSDAWDQNRNGLVCAFQLRGTKAYLGDPFVNLTYFGISDDRIGR
jgi:hypothetical protein